MSLLLHIGHWLFLTGTRVEGGGRGIDGPQWAVSRELPNRPGDSMYTVAKALKRL